MLRKISFIVFLIILLGSNVYAEEEPITINDPYESVNRTIFDFNDRLDITILKPIAMLYNKIIPKPLNKGVNNFFNNIHNLPNIANDLLQLHFYQATSDSWRLMINTTIGIGGLFDIAERINLALYSNDFGLTLAYWGYKNSNYIVWPFWGPSTLRDGIGGVVDYFVFSIYPHVNPPLRRYSLYGLGVVDRRVQLLPYQSVLEEVTFDKYIFARQAHMQNRIYQIEYNSQLSYYSDKKNAISS